MRTNTSPRAMPAVAALDALLVQVELALASGGMPPELVAAVVELARKGAGMSQPPGRSASSSGGDRVAQLERLWTMRELAVFLDVHERTVLRHIESGRLRSTRVGRQHRFRQSDVDAYLARAISGHEQHAHGASPAAARGAVAGDAA